MRRAAFPYRSFARATPFSSCCSSERRRRRPWPLDTIGPIRNSATERRNPNRSGCLLPLGIAAFLGVLLAIKRRRPVGLQVHRRPGGASQMLRRRHADAARQGRADTQPLMDDDHDADDVGSSSRPRMRDSGLCRNGAQGAQRAYWLLPALPAVMIAIVAIRVYVFVPGCADGGASPRRLAGGAETVASHRACSTR